MSANKNIFSSCIISDTSFIISINFSFTSFMKLIFLSLNKDLFDISLSELINIGIPCSNFFFIVVVNTRNRSNNNRGE